MLLICNKIAKTYDYLGKEVKFMKREYTSPAMVRLSGKENDYGAAIGAVAVWVIGIGPAWVW